MTKRTKRKIQVKPPPLPYTQYPDSINSARPPLVNMLLEAIGGRDSERVPQPEDPVDTIYRIIHERDQALLILGLDRLRNFREGRL